MSHAELPRRGSLALVYPVVGLFLLYWVVRLAVRHGVLDAEESRGQS